MEPLLHMGRNKPSRFSVTPNNDHSRPSRDVSAGGTIPGRPSSSLHLTRRPPLAHNQPHDRGTAGQSQQAVDRCRPTNSVELVSLDLFRFFQSLYHMATVELEPGLVGFPRYTSRVRTPTPERVVVRDGNVQEQCRVQTYLQPYVGKVHVRCQLNPFPAVWECGIRGVGEVDPPNPEPVGSRINGHQRFVDYEGRVVRVRLASGIHRLTRDEQHSGLVGVPIQIEAQRGQFQREEISQKSWYVPLVEQGVAVAIDR